MRRIFVALILILLLSSVSYSTDRIMTLDLSTGQQKAQLSTNTQIVFIFDGGGSAVSTGAKTDVRIPFNMTITSWEITTDTSATVTVDIWKDTYANYPPTDADTITNGHEVAVSAGVKNQDLDLSDWTTVTVSEGDRIKPNVDANDNATVITVVLYGVRT